MFEAALILLAIPAVHEALTGGLTQPNERRSMFRLYWCLPPEQGGQYLLSTHSTEEAAEEAAVAFEASLPGVRPTVEIVREEVTV